MRIHEFNTLEEIRKGQKDSNGSSSCWTGYHAAGTKKGKNGGRVRNCVPNESVTESQGKRCMQCGMKDCKCPGDTCKCKPIAGWIPGKGFAGAGQEHLKEMPAHLRNDPEGHTIIPHGGMGSGNEDTWRRVSIGKLEQCIDMIKTGNYRGAEHTVYANGFLEGAIRALARYEEFRQKQGRRPLARGREVELGE
jgi:hypothetical protein